MTKCASGGARVPGAAGRVLRNGRLRPLAPAIIGQRIAQDAFHVLNFRLLVYKLRRGAA